MANGLHLWYYEHQLIYSLFIDVASIQVINISMYSSDLVTAIVWISGEDSDISQILFNPKSNAKMSSKNVQNASVSKNCPIMVVVFINISLHSLYLLTVTDVHWDGRTLQWCSLNCAPLTYNVEKCVYSPTLACQKIVQENVDWPN